MPIYTISLQGKNLIANDTFEFQFEKPAGFQFTPGQYGGFTLINPPATDAKGNTRRFSFVSKPSDDLIRIVTRILPTERSAYKHCLSALPPAAPIKLAGPTGLFTLDTNDVKPLVMIAGGVGIAPFYSMLQALAEQNSTRTITLFYGNLSSGHIAYRQEMQTLAQQLSNFKAIMTIDQPEPSWHGETGYITSEMIKRHLVDVLACDYMVCGSPTMVTLMQEMLAELDIPLTQIKVEDFPGY